MCPKIWVLFPLVLTIILIGCITHKEAYPGEMIKSTECDRITVKKKNKYREWEETYCLTTFKKLKDLYGNYSIAYVGSNDKLHFFYWYTKRAYYKDQPTGFAVLRYEYTPKSEFDVQKAIIGEHPFGKGENGK